MTSPAFDRSTRSRPARGRVVWPDPKVVRAVHVRATTRVTLRHRQAVAPRGRPPRDSRIVAAPSFVIAAANAFVGLDLTAGAMRAFGNPPSVAERFLREVGALQALEVTVSRRRRLPAWDAAFIQHVGYWALYGGTPPRSSWPLPAVRSADELSRLAGHWNLLERDPAIGDLYLLWSDATRRFVRTGIVVRVIPTPRGHKRLIHRCEVIEGGTSKERRHDGGQVLRLERRFGPDDRFVRWTRWDDPRDFNPAEEAECA